MSSSFSSIQTPSAGLSSGTAVGNASSLSPQLARLEASGLIQLAQVQPELEYIFRHALLHAAAYGSLLKSQRRELHRQVGETLESLYAPPTPGLAARLGYHFTEAGDDARALRYLTQAGEEAARAYANAEAATHYAQAFSIAQRLPTPSDQVITIATQLGRVQELRSQHHEALQTYTRLEALARERGDRTMTLAAWLAQAVVRINPTRVSDRAQGRVLCEQALALAGELGDRRAEAYTLWCLATLEKFNNRPTEALAYAEQALTLTRSLNLRELTAFVLNDSAPAYLFLGQPMRSQTVLEEAATLWRELGNLPMLTDTLNNLALVGSMLGRHADSLALAEEAYRLSVRIGNPWGRAVGRFAMSLPHLERGETEAALATLEESLRLSAEVGLAPARLEGGRLQAYAFACGGNMERALTLAQPLRPTSDEPLTVWSIMPLAVLAQLYLWRGDEAEVEFVLQTFGRDALAASPLAGVFVPLLQAQLLLLRGQVEAALPLLDKALRLMQAGNIHLFRADALYYRGQVLARQGQLAAAEAALAEAQAEAETTEGRRSSWRILAAQSQLAAQRGDPAKHHALRQQAQEVIAFLAEHCPREWRVRFLDQPDVQAV